MNLRKPHVNDFMKTAYLTPICAVQSITYTPERRVIKLASTVPGLITTRPAGKRRPAPFLLKIRMRPEAASGFEPTIQIRSQTKF
jgi:hypothetical protein